MDNDYMYIQLMQVPLKYAVKLLDSLFPSLMMILTFWNNGVKPSNAVEGAICS